MPTREEMMVGIALSFAVRRSPRAELQQPVRLPTTGTLLASSTTGTPLVASSTTGTLLVVVVEVYTIQRGPWIDYRRESWYAIMSQIEWEPTALVSQSSRESLPVSTLKFCSRIPTTRYDEVRVRH
jgi:hypothetical protein